MQRKKITAARTFREKKQQSRVFFDAIFDVYTHLDNRERARETNFVYPASRGFSLAWLLAFTKSFACLVCRVVGLFTPREKPLR